MRRLVVSLVAAVVALSLVPIASAQEEDDQVALRVGLTQDWEVLNPTSGYTVAAYEVWNLHYATLTDKAAEDFATIPGLAESWEEVEPGIEYVYTMREGLTWSDGEPLTAEDVAWNINTGRDQGWDNMVSTVANIEATAEDERTVRLVSSVPDPKLPTMDVYLVPQHIWEPIATDYDATTQYAADDGVGSGPFVMTEFTPGQSVVMEVNRSYWGWEGEEPPYDQVIFRLFENPDAMVAALQQGELDAAQSIPASSWDALEADENIELVAGQQGGFDQIAINGGAAEGQPHPALLDVEVRRAIAHAIDRPAVIEDLYFGLASPLETISPSADPKWMPEIPEGDRFDYDPALANQILDDAGYLDSDGDGVREMPDGTNPLVIRHAVNTDGDLAGVDRRPDGGMDGGDRHRRYPRVVRRGCAVWCACRGDLRHLLLGLGAFRRPRPHARPISPRQSSATTTTPTGSIPHTTRSTRNKTRRSIRTEGWRSSTRC